jgi:nucleoside-diphosphate-sugar epimerase
MSVIVDRVPVLLGATGLLGRSIKASLSIPEDRVIGREVYSSWNAASSHAQILDQLPEIDLNRLDIFVATGITNPKLDPDLIWKLNFHVPRSLIDATKDSDARVITFGTIHELYSVENEYFASKRALVEYLQNSTGPSNSRHFQLHTLYSDNPPPDFMFLGQMYRAIKESLEFSMSAGLQLREFHHVDDVTRSVIKLLNEPSRKIQDISAGIGIPIRDLAMEVFSTFGFESKLHLGVYPAPVGDNFVRVFRMTEGLRSADFRDPLIEIPRLFKRLLGERWM